MYRRSTMLIIFHFEFLVNSDCTKFHLQIAWLCMDVAYRVITNRNFDNYAYLIFFLLIYISTLRFYIKNSNMFNFTPKSRSLVTVPSVTYLATLVGRGFPIIFMSKSWSCKFQLLEVNQKCTSLAFCK